MFMFMVMSINAKVVEKDAGGSPKLTKQTSEAAKLAKHAKRSSSSSKTKSVSKSGGPSSSKGKKKGSGRTLRGGEKDKSSEKSEDVSASAKQAAPGREVTGRAIVPLEPQEAPDVSRDDPLWSSKVETQRRASTVQKVVKKASRMNNKRQRGTGRQVETQAKKPLSAMTLKEIIKQSVEADRTENRKRPRVPRGSAAAAQEAAKEGEAAEGGKGKGASRDGGRAEGSHSGVAGAGPSSSKDSIAPQVQVVDGQIVINRESLSVKAQVETVMKPERRVEESGNKLSAFSYSGYLAPEKWTKEDTDKFYKALEQFGTDFGTIQKFFPKRERKQIKSKFRREEKGNPEKIEKALDTHRGMSAEVCVENLKKLVELMQRAEQDNS
ncbi:subunit of Bdp1 transcription initiation factor TFIIIB [Chloropicon primus]|nr:subunit of Bdp1 transcription initiation factor TFIIIB [Chloropicon primus]